MAPIMLLAVLTVCIHMLNASIINSRVLLIVPTVLVIVCRQALLFVVSTALNIKSVWHINDPHGFMFRSNASFRLQSVFNKQSDWPLCLSLTVLVIVTVVVVVVVVVVEVVVVIVDKWGALESM